MVIRKTAALLLFAKALASEADKMGWEDFWERLQMRLTVRRKLCAESARRGHSVTFSQAGESLLFEKEGCTMRIGPQQMIGRRSA